MSLLKHDQRGQEIADSEHNGAKSIYTIALKANVSQEKLSLMPCS